MTTVKASKKRRKRRAVIPFWETLSFWITVCTWTIVVCGHYVGAIPEPYGLVVANIVAVIYTVLRCLEKRQAGVPWKGIISTSEFTITSLTVISNLLESLKQLPALSPRMLGFISMGIAAIAAVLHSLSGKKPPSGLPSLIISDGAPHVEKPKT
jgi:hypothetical protein